MKLTEKNIKDLPIKDNEKRLLKALLEDLHFINAYLVNQCKKPIFINFQDFHNQYSPERVDPCPDYYGMYTLTSDSLAGKILGVEMTLSDLDDTLCMLYNFVELLQ